jgi:hypothetical protein
VRGIVGVLCFPERYCIYEHDFQMEKLFSGEILNGFFRIFQGPKDPSADRNGISM